MHLYKINGRWFVAAPSYEHAIRAWNNRNLRAITSVELVEEHIIIWKD